MRASVRLPTTSAVDGSITGSCERLGEAIGQMTDQSLSQLPVIDPSTAEVVGSLTEARILHLLIESPEHKSEPVHEAMGEPFPTVPRSMDLGLLSAYLEDESGAVLVEPERAAGPSGDGGAQAGYDIITKSDLITALSRVDAGGNGR